MYQVHLCVHLIGADHAAAEALRHVVPPERFYLKFTDFPALTEEAADGDILVLCGGASDGELALAASRKKSGVLTVLCAEGARLAELTPEQMEALSALWSLPLTPELAAFHFSSLLAALKQRKDAWLFQRYLDSAINSIPELIWFKDARGAHLKVNQSFCQAVNKTMEQIEGRGHYYIWDIPEEEYKRGEYICLESEEETMEKGCTCLFDENVKTKRGMRQFKTYKTPIFDEDGHTILGTVGVAHDVTDLHNMNQELELIISSIPQSAVVCDENWHILSANQTARQYLGSTGLDLIGMDYRWVKEQVLRDEKPGMRPDCREGTILLDGNSHIMQFQELPITDVFRHVTGYLCLYTDVTRERSYEAEILHIANTDSLTGLGTRRHFFSELANHPGGTPAALLYMDLDNFKNVNDHFGHQFGDRILTTVAECIRIVFPSDLNARMGGDEFVTALWGTQEPASLSERAELLQHLVRNRIRTLSEGRLTMSLCIGIACAAGPDTTVDRLMHQGDVAMYASKRREKGGCLFYSPDMEEEADRI